MKHIDNFDKIKKLLVFSSDDTFYHLQILKRRKEHPTLGRNSICMRTLCIDSIEDLERNKEDIIKMCDALNIRAYINLNARSYRLASLETNDKIAKQLKQDDYKSIRKAFTSVLGSLGVKKGYEKRWILDCDDMTLETVIAIGKELEPIQPSGEKVFEIVETKNGFHIICRPFDVRTFDEICERYGVHIDIQRNNPTILYV